MKYLLFCVLFYIDLVHIHGINNDLPKIIVAFTNLTYVHTPWYNTFNDSTLSEQIKNNLSIFQNETLLIVNRNQFGSIILHCNASYPVTWTMDSIDNQWVEGVIADRSFTNISDPSTYLYSISIRLNWNLYKDYVENFICHGVENNTVTLKSNLLIVREKREPPYWKINPSMTPTVENHTFSDTTYLIKHIHTIHWNSSEKPNILLPCFTLNVNESHVELYKKVNGTIVDMTENEIIKYEEYVGFYISPSTIISEKEKFICVIKNFNETNIESKNTTTTLSTEVEEIEWYYDMDGEIQPRKKPRDIIPENESIAIFYIMKDTIAQPEKTNTSEVWYGKSLYGREMYCCALNRIMNTRTLGFLEGECNEPLRCLTEKYTWTIASRLYSYAKNSTCIEIYRTALLSFTPSMLKCADKEEKVATKGIFRGTPFTSLTLESNTTSDLFTGQTIQMTCSANSFYFAKGLIWEIEYKNNSMKIHSGTRYLYSGFFYENKIRTMFILSTTDIKKISCKAPIWNSTLWMTKDFPLRIQVPTFRSSKPETDNIIQNVSFYTGQSVKLDCDFEGTPIPSYDWIKPYSVFSISPGYGGYSSYRSTSAASTSKSVTVTAYSGSVGIFKCTAKNFAGSATRIFSVTSIMSLFPMIVGGKKETIVFYTGDEDQKINCSISQGVPIPAFTWRRYEQNVTEISGLEIFTLGNESHLIFNIVKPEHEGEYICTTTNFKSSVSKEYILRVKDRIHSRVWLEVTVIILLVILIFVFAGWFYIYKTKSKKITDLKKVVEFSKHELETCESMATISPLVHN